MPFEFFRKSLKVVSTVACLFLAVCGLQAEAQSGLLLGLRGHAAEFDGTRSYRTLWISPQAGTVRVMVLPDLIVPRKTGFWRVGTRSYCDPEDVKRSPDVEPGAKGVLFAAPVEQRPTVHGVTPCPKTNRHSYIEGNCKDGEPDGESGVDISFVNPEYLSLEDWWTTNCTGGGASDGGSHLYVARLDDPSRKPIPYSQMEGGGTRDEYERRAADALLDDANDEELLKQHPNWHQMNNVQRLRAVETEDDPCYPKPEETEWSIRRSGETWRAKGQVETRRICGYYRDFPLPLHASFATTAAAPISFETIRSHVTIAGVPDLKEIWGVVAAFWSPNHDMLAVEIRQDEACKLRQLCPPLEEAFEHPGNILLQIYTPQGQDLGKPILSMQLGEGGTPVMAEWALGSSVARWNTELRKIKAQGVVRPNLAASPQP